MKKAGILLFAVTFIFMSFAKPTIQKKKILKVDTINSTINWRGYKPTGSHHGTINLVSGNLEMEEGVLKGGSFTVDMLTLKDAGRSAKLEGHLKSADFFEVQVYTTSKFEITSSENKDGKTFVTGNITIKGITKQITFAATVVETAESVTLTSETFQINREEFNVKYKSRSFFNNLKDKFINDEFDLQVTIIALK